MIYDVIIVGASIAGLTACETASRFGCSTLLVDKRPSLQVPRAALSVIGAIESLEGKGGKEIPLELIPHRVSGFRILSPGGRALDFKTPGFILSRPAYDLHLTKAIEKKGGHVLPGVDVLSISVEGQDNAEVEIARDGAKETLRTRIAVDASGAGSSVHLPPAFSPLRFPDDLAAGAQVEIEGVRLNPNVFEFYLGREIAPGWKAAILPTGQERATFGAYPRVKGGRAEDFLDAFLHLPAIQEKWHGGKRGEVQEGWDPVAALPERLAGDHLLVVGGRGGQAGIPYAVFAGRLAGEAAAASVQEGDFSENFLRSYELGWKKKCMKDFAQARKALLLLEKLEDRAVDRIFETLSRIGFPEGYFSAGKLRKGKLLRRIARNDPGALFLLLKAL